MEIKNQDMKQHILSFPKQFKKGIESAKNVSLKSYDLPMPPENIIICGMGGSALPGEILSSLRPLNIFLHKSYGLPLQAGLGSLIICISYSGNTEETISSFNEALKNKLPLISITSGGKLKKLSKENNIPFAIIPEKNLVPRLALAMQFACLAKILENLNLMPSSFTKEILSLEEKLEGLEEKGARLAEKLYKKLILVYTAKSLSSTALIWKNYLNENAKVLAISNYFPELSHNEICGFKNGFQKEPIVLFLKDTEDHPQILKQMEAAKEILIKENIETETVTIEGRTILEKVFSSILLGIWTSYFLASKYNTDPVQNKLIQEIKKKIKS